jgi:hypothetical protein
MNATGASFQPELIELMKAVLDDATAMHPEAKRTSAIKAEIASHILASGAKGERDPVALKNGRPFSRRRVHALFARNFAGAPGRLSACYLDFDCGPAKRRQASARWTRGMLYLPCLNASRGRAGRRRDATACLERVR